VLTTVATLHSRPRWPIWTHLTRKFRGISNWTLWALYLLCFSQQNIDKPNSSVEMSSMSGIGTIPVSSRLRTHQSLVQFEIPLNFCWEKHSRYRAHRPHFCQGQTKTTNQVIWQRPRSEGAKGRRANQKLVYGPYICCASPNKILTNQTRPWKCQACRG
jgi:hypothetical protein